MFLLFLIATLRRVWKVKPLSQPKIENMEIISSFNEPCLGELRAVLNNGRATPLGFYQLFIWERGFCWFTICFWWLGIELTYAVEQMCFLKCVWILFRWWLAFSKFWWSPYPMLKGVTGCKIHFSSCLNINLCWKCVYTSSYNDKNPPSVFF